MHNLSIARQNTLQVQKQVLPQVIKEQFYVKRYNHGMGGSISGVIDDTVNQCWPVG